MWDHSFGELFVRGGFVMWPLLAFSCVAVAVGIERLVVFALQSRSYEPFVRNLKQGLNTRRPDEVVLQLDDEKSVYARVARTYFAYANRSDKLREEAVAKTASEQITLLERRLNWLSMIAHLAPMVGLLGTVVGLVDAFHQIEVVGGQVQPGDLASGIWKALLTTVFGLVVALPTLAVYQTLDHRAAAVALRFQWLVALLNDWNDQRQRPQSATDSRSSKRPREKPTRKNQQASVSAQVVEAELVSELVTKEKEPGRDDATAPNQTLSTS